MGTACNVLGTPLVPCSTDPLTGFYRDGCCNTGAGDAGVHVVCAVMTDVFLAFSRERGNDLVTPNPEWGFPGLRPSRSRGASRRKCSLRSMRPGSRAWT